MRKLLEEGEPFANVLTAELDAIEARRVCARFGAAAARCEEASSSPARRAGEGEGPWAERQAAFDTENRARALAQDLVGLSLSGGGIRSATFNLGVLQALASLRLLTRIDYLSTVSGGGYIGAWLAAWIRREGEAPDPDQKKEWTDAGLLEERPDDPLSNVELQLDVNRIEQSRATRPVAVNHRVVDEEPEAIQHLRAYSNYLTPRPGLFTADTWTVLAIYVRNLLLNQLMLLPLAVAFVTGIWLLVLLYAPRPETMIATEGRVRGFLFILLLTIAFFTIALELTKLYRERTTRRDGLRDAVQGLLEQWGLTWVAKPIGTNWLLVLVVWSLMGCAVLSCWLFGIRTDATLNWSGFHRVTDALRFLPLIGERFNARAAYASWDGGEFPWKGAAKFAVVFGLLHFWAHFFANLLAVLLDGLVLLFERRDTGRWRDRPAEGWWAVIGTRLVRDGTLDLAAFASGCVGGFLFYTVMITVLWQLRPYPYALATVGPPLALLVFILGAYSEVGLLGRSLGEAEREWWSRITALLIIHGLAWMVVFGSVIYVPYAVQWLAQRFGPSVTPGLVLGWLATALGGAKAGRSPATGGRVRNQALEILASVAPPLFLVGLLASVSWLIQAWVVNIDIEKNFLQETNQVISAASPLAHRASKLDLWLCLAGNLVFGGAMTYFLNVNLFSLHTMYANRLVRCYLGASRRKEEWLRRWRFGVWHPGLGGAPTGSLGTLRHGQLLTGFDVRDDLPLRDLRIGPRGEATDVERPDDRGYWGPFRLINTALNLVAGQELAWQDRKAESFVLTPLYCGSKSTGYRRLPREADDLMTLGRATAISGAAADPNMGYHQSAPVTALMTIFNTRLGWWLENPRYPGWESRSPSFGGLILHELFGRTDENGRFVHLSDGGHFENLGVYELVRRRCRYVIACDAGQDRDSVYEDLANVSRLCRTDFGVRIEIDTSPLRWQGNQHFGRWHCAIGQIHYEDVDSNETPGLLVYLKASLTGDEPTDVQNYASLNADFPHQTTADQWFDERQFESYRALGYHVANAVLSGSVRDSGIGSVPQERSPAGETFARRAEAARRAFRVENKALFAKLRSRWFPAPPDIEATYGETAQAFNVIQGILRSDKNLRGSSRELYPELPRSSSVASGAGGTALPTHVSARRTAELHVVNQIIQVMENAWLGVQMEGYPEHPVNRGWMNAFRRCGHSALMHRYWPVVRGGFHQEFVRFCERELRLPDGSPHAFPLAAHGTGLVFPGGGVPGANEDKAARMVERLGREFSREWPELPGLPRLVEAVVNTDRDETRAWLVCTTRAGKPSYACGVVLAWEKAKLPEMGLPDDGFLTHSLSEGDIGLLVWLRGPYRNVQIGRACFDDGPSSPLKHLLAQFPGRTLCTRFPSTRPTGRDIEKEIWLNFFYHYDFRGAGTKDIEEGKDLVLRRKIGT
jgi:hypothetical protein